MGLGTRTRGCVSGKCPAPGERGRKSLSTKCWSPSWGRAAQDQHGHQHHVPTLWPGDPAGSEVGNTRWCSLPAPAGAAPRGGHPSPGSQTLCGHRTARGECHQLLQTPGRTDRWAEQPRARPQKHPGSGVPRASTSKPCALRVASAGSSLPGGRAWERNILVHERATPMDEQPGSGPHDEGKPPEGNGFPEDSPRRCQAHLPCHPGTATPTLGVPAGSPWHGRTRSHEALGREIMFVMGQGRAGERRSAASGGLFCISKENASASESRGVLAPNGAERL